MIQILGLRSFVNDQGDEIVYDAFFEKKWRYATVPHLFNNLEEAVNDIPEHERYNMFYTVASCVEKKGRIFANQSVIPFDIDGIDPAKKEDYIKPICDALLIDREKTGIVFTGHGFHFLVEMEEPFDDEEYFDTYKKFYSACCGNIAQGLFSAGLMGHADTSVFGKGRLLRLPLTINKKDGKVPVKAEIINSNIQPQDFDLHTVSGIPVIDISEQMSEEALKRFPDPDPDGVMEKCGFMQYCRDNQNDVSEPQWYAMLSIVGRFPDAREWAHLMSDKHEKYRADHTDRKLKQAVENSGPRTCESISNLWEGCVGCEQFGKCASPIVLRDDSKPTTSGSGFYHIEVLENGKVKRTPDYEGLLKQFELDHKYKADAESRLVYTFNGTHWEYVTKAYIENYAESKFDPKPNSNMCKEFYNKVLRNNLFDVSWFKVQNSINFANGVLDLETYILEEHSPKYGFTYVLPFDYDPDADCPEFDKFMGRITTNDKELQDVLVEFMAYSLAGIDSSIGQKALILHGDGANGKSVFTRLLCDLAGEGNYSTVSMGRDIGRPESRASLHGKLFNVTEETPTSALADSTIFKALVSGGDVEARKLYSNPFTLRNNAKIIMACNNLPPSIDKSHGLLRRLIIVPFNARFSPRDTDFNPFISDDLLSEASGIYNRVLEGLSRFRSTNIFTEPAKMLETLEEYAHDNNSALEWFEDCTEVIEGESCKLLDVYSSYKFDMEDQGAKPYALTTFRKQAIIYCEKHGLEIETKKTAGQRRAKFIKGLKLLK